MKKLFTLSLWLCLGVTTAFAQYYVLEVPNAGQNPGNLNNDEEQPWGYINATYGDYDSIIGPVGGAQWSTQQTLPFNFTFNGVNQTSYFVSTTGVLTFSASPGAAPGLTNSALPSASIPDNSICVWGLNVGGGNDAVVSKTFGTAPNRQHWVIFASASEPGIDRWTYWGIVLEESSNKVYIVDMRTYSTTSGNVSLTVGLQLNSTTAFSVNASPNVQSVTTATGGNGSDATDNGYYEFGTGTAPQWDLKLENVTLNGSSNMTATLKTNNTIGGTVFNNATQTVTSFDVTYTVGSSAPVTQTISGVNIPGGSSYTFSHSTPWNPTTGAGAFANMTVEISNLNGNTDENPADNKISNQVFVNLGVSTTKYVLLEEYSTAPCGFCPDGLLVVEDILNTINNVILGQIHAGFGTDAMTIPAHTQWAAAYAPGAPTAMVDRILFDGETSVGFSRGLWKQRVQEQLNTLTPVNVNVRGDYDPNGDKVTVTVNANFVDYGTPGTYHMNIYVTEDSVTGSGPGYDQRNYYSASGGAAGGPNHPFYNEPDPIVGYNHQHVIRDVPTGTWGMPGIIPNSPQPNQTYSDDFTITLNPNWDRDQLYLVAFVTKHDAANVNNRPVLNAYEVKLTELSGVDVAPQPEAMQVELFPNPAGDMAQLGFELPATSEVSVEVMNMIGQQNMVFAQQRTYAAGQQYITLPSGNWDAGMYLVRVRVNDRVTIKKLVVAH